MPFLELFDETLDINSTANYDLSVQMSPESLTFCILDTIRNKYVMLRSFDPGDNKYFTSGTLADIIEKDDFLVKNYRKVYLVTPSPRFTIVPSPLFDPAKKEEYFTLNHINDENNVILSNRIQEPDSFIIFSLSKQTHETAVKFFPSVHPFHHTKPLIGQIAHNNRSTPGSFIHLHIESSFFNIFVFENNIMKFSNSFNYRNVSDILYFALNIFKSMNISKDETIHFSGLTEKYDDIYSGFAMYIRNIRFIPPTGRFTFSYVFNDIELHRYINLFSVADCE
jgi:hypothetical protein